MSITVTHKEVLVNGKTVATIADEDSWTALSLALLNSLRKDEAVFLAVHLLNEIHEKKDGVRTSEVANYLNMDRANCTKALERLLDAGRISVGGQTEKGGAGRPSRLWKVAR